MSDPGPRSYWPLFDLVIRTPRLEIRLPREDEFGALLAVIEDGIPLKGYIHWSAFDNFEWASGYSMQFGLIAVDRTTQVRTMKPSARFLGELARANRLKGPGV